MPTRSFPTVTQADCEALYRELLRLGAHGASKAVPRRLVAAGAFGGNDRKMRHVMAAAPGFGFAVGSCEDGYFLATGPADIDRAVAELHSRIGELSKRALDLQRLRTAPEFSERLF